MIDNYRLYLKIKKIIQSINFDYKILLYYFQKKKLYWFLQYFSITIKEYNKTKFYLGLSGKIK